VCVVNVVNVFLARIRTQPISCGAHKLCANKLLFVKWLCIRSSTCTYYMCADVCLSFCLSALVLHLIAHEYVSWQICNTHSSHIQFISINSRTHAFCMLFIGHFNRILTMSLVAFSLSLSLCLSYFLWGFSSSFSLDN